MYNNYYYPKNNSYIPSPRDLRDLETRGRCYVTHMLALTNQIGEFHCTGL